MKTHYPTSRPEHYYLPGATRAVDYDLAWLLLTAPKDRRLDLALASMMHTWKLQLSETVKDGKRVLVPLWYFQKFPNEPKYHFTHTLYSLLPGIAPLLADQVPFYSRSEATDRYHGASHNLRDWLSETGIESTLNYGQPLSVHLKYNAGKGVHLLKEPEGLTLPCREVRMAKLLARAVVGFLAPDLVPYLESEVEFPVPDLAELASQEARKPLYQVVLLPLMLGTHRDPECMYLEWDSRLDHLFTCLALKQMHPQEDDDDDEKEEEYGPSQCPCCGGYYCERHFSKVQQAFTLTREEISQYGKLAAELSICCNCALLEEPARLAVRAAFLLANGKQPYTPDRSTEGERERKAHDSNS